MKSHRTILAAALIAGFIMSAAPAPASWIPDPWVEPASIIQAPVRLPAGASGGGSELDAVANLSLLWLGVL